MMQALAYGLLATVLSAQHVSREPLDEPVDKESIVRRWNELGYSASARFEVRTWRSASSLLVSSRSKKPASADQQFSDNVELTFVGDAVLEQRNGFHWFGDLGETRSRQTLSLVDRTTRKEFLDVVANYTDAVATIAEANVAPPFTTETLPAFAACRPIHSNHGPFRDRKNWKLVGEPVSPERLECLRLEHRQEWVAARLSAADYVQEAYVDPARDYAIVRWNEWGGGNLTVQLDIDHKEQQGRWLPSAWRAQIFRPHAPHDLIEEQSVQAVEWQLAELAELPDFMDLLPPRTLLRDLRSQRAWIVRDDGTHRPVTADELSRNVSRQELLAMPPGWAGRTIAYHAFSSLSWIVPIFLAFMLAGLVYLRRRASRG